MEKKRLKQLIRGKGKQNPGERTRGKEAARSKEFEAGDIVIYSSMVKDALFKDENDGKIYLCLGDAESDELGVLGSLLSGSFNDLRVVAVLEDCGDVHFFLPEELEAAKKNDE